MNIDANWGPLLLMIFFGMPCIFHMLSRYILATSLEKIEAIVTISLIILENWSTTTKIAFLSFDLSRGPIMSMLISSYSVFGIDKGCKGATFFMCCTCSVNIPGILGCIFVCHCIFLIIYQKLHLAISPSILYLFSRS